MGVPTVLMFVGFLVLLGFPALQQITGPDPVTNPNNPTGTWLGADARSSGSPGVDRPWASRNSSNCTGVPAHDVLVLERVAGAQVPVWLGLDDPRRDARECEQILGRIGRGWHGCGWHGCSGVRRRGRRGAGWGGVGGQ